MNYEELYLWKSIVEENNLGLIYNKEKKLIKQGIKTKIEEQDDTYKLYVPMRYESISKDIVEADYLLEVVDNQTSIYHAFDDLHMSVEDFLNKREVIREKYEVTRWPMRLSYVVLALGSMIWLFFMIIK